MGIEGLRTTRDWIAQYYEMPENWREGVLKLMPNGMAALYALTSVMKKRVTDDPRFHWFEEGLPNYRIQLSSSINDSVTTIPIVSGALPLKPGDVLLVEQTKEILYVTTEPSIDTSITLVTRGAHGSTAAAVTLAAGINPNILLVGSSYAEGSLAPEPRSYNPTHQYNYTQIFRNTFQISGTRQHTKARTGPIVSEDKRKCLERHTMGIEWAMWFGSRSVDTSAIRRTTNGIYYQIPTANQHTPESGNSMDLEEVEAIMKSAFLYGSNEKMGFCGNDFLLGIEQLCRKNSSFQLLSDGKQQEYGMNITRLRSPFGTLVLKTHPMFNQIGSGEYSGTAYHSVSSWCFILDMKNITYVHMEGRDTQYQKNMQTPGQDAILEGFMTECGLELAHATTHHLITGLTGGKADGA